MQQFAIGKSANANGKRRWEQGIEYLRENKPLALVGGISAVLLILTLIGQLVDPRLVLSEPVWRKPAKFAVSIALYCLTLLWLMTFIKGYTRTLKVVSWVTAVGFIVEIATIFYQAWRGVRSHFNNTTAFDSAIYSAMGISIVFVSLVGMLAAILLLLQRIDNRPFGAGLKAGLLISMLGAGLGALMTLPSAQQMAQMQQTSEMTQYVGAHSVGVPDGGPGLPITGWSTEGGDLRVGHFIGLHAMQVLPLLGWIVSRRYRYLPEKRQTWMVRIFSLGYLGLIGLATWQALRGQSIVAPDVWTLAAFGGLVAAVLASWLVLARRA